jgi:hypothetical protein
MSIEDFDEKNWVKSYVKLAIEAGIDPQEAVCAGVDIAAKMALARRRKNTSIDAAYEEFLACGLKPKQAHIAALKRANGSIRGFVSVVDMLPKEMRQQPKQQVTPRAASGLNKTVLTVPFKEKNEAKALGAKWDNRQKCWFVTTSENLDLFCKWRIKKPTKLKTHCKTVKTQATKKNKVSIHERETADACQIN